MKTKEIYKAIFCEYCGKCDGKNIEIVENKLDKLKTIKCKYINQKINEYDT